MGNSFEVPGVKPLIGANKCKNDEPVKFGPKAEKVLVYCMQLADLV